MMKPSPVSGNCTPEFESVRQAFVGNFTERGEIGAAVAVVHRGELVVDLWGGYADAKRHRPWTPDTLTNVWSTTKGVAALCFAMLVDRGHMKYDDPVSRYWPEFAANGKECITIAQLLSHQAGLCGFERSVAIEDIYNQPRAESLLAAQSPFWEPGTQSGYHAVTFGVLANAVFQRIEGRTLAAFVREELSFPYDLDICIGLSDSEAARASEIIAPPTLSSTDSNPIPSRAQQAALANPVLDPLLANTRPWRLAPLPSVNAFSTASALAQLYGALAHGGVIKGRRLLGNDAIRAASALRIEGLDAVMGLEMRWAAGFMRNTYSIYGDNPNAFGHSGWGGSFAFADPDRCLGVAYVMNCMDQNVVGDPRGTTLVASVLDSVSG